MYGALVSASLPTSIADMAADSRDSSAKASASSSSATSSAAASSSQQQRQQADKAPPPYFSSHAIDHAVAGIGAGAVATVCMNPLDLIKVKFQIDTRPVPPLLALVQSARQVSLRDVLTGGRVGREMYASLKDIVQDQGWKGLYRGLSPNVVGNSASWGLYFLWYTMIKDYMARQPQSAAGGETSSKAVKLSAAQHLLAASISGGATAMLTNPIWVVKTRMFAAPASRAATAGGDPAVVAYRGLWDGLASTYRHEGIRGLYRGAGLALVGVSNGAIQFTAYEQLKRQRSSLAMRRRSAGGSGAAAQDIPEGGVKLSNTEYILMSGASKMVAIFLTYPYQVVRSRIQNNATNHLYPNIPACIRRTYTHEGGVRAFYKGLAANVVRILPGTCVTFVVYEQIAWALREAAQDKQRLQLQRESDELEEQERKRKLATLLFKQRQGDHASSGAAREGHPMPDDLHHPRDQAFAKKQAA